MLHQQHRCYTNNTGVTPTAPVLHQQHRCYTNNTGVWTTREHGHAFNPMRRGGSSLTTSYFTHLAKISHTAGKLLPFRSAHQTLRPKFRVWGRVKVSLVTVDSSKTPEKSFQCPGGGGKWGLSPRVTDVSSWVQASWQVRAPSRKQRTDRGRNTGADWPNAPVSHDDDIEGVR